MKIPIPETWKTLKDHLIAASPRRAVRRYRVSSGARILLKVCLENVLPPHPVGIEVGAIERYRVSHDVDISVPVPVEERDDQLLELGVHRVRVRLALPRVDLAFGEASNRPARHAFDGSFDPPAVEDAQGRHAVEGR